MDVMHSDWDCTLEGLPHPPSVRLGLRLVVGLKAESANQILGARKEAPFDGFLQKPINGQALARLIGSPV